MGTAIDRHTRIQSLNKEPSHVHTINTKPLDAKFHWWRRFEFACGVRRRGVVRIFWTVVLVLRVLPPRCYRCLELGLLCFEDCGATLWPSITSPLESCGENQHSCTARGCSFAPLPQLHPTIWRCRWGSSGTLRAVVLGGLAQRCPACLSGWRGACRALWGRVLRGCPSETRREVCRLVFLIVLVEALLNVSPSWAPVDSLALAVLGLLGCIDDDAGCSASRLRRAVAGRRFPLGSVAVTLPTSICATSVEKRRGLRTGSEACRAAARSCLGVG